MNHFLKKIPSLSLLVLGVIIMGSFALLAEPQPAAAQGACRITSAEFNPYTIPTTPVKELDEAFNDNVRFQVTITVTTSGCANDSVYVALLGHLKDADLTSVDFLTSPIVALADAAFASGDDETVTPVPVLKWRKFIVPQDERLVISLGSGENLCFQNLVGNDCIYSIGVMSSIDAYSAIPTQAELETAARFILSQYGQSTAPAAVAALAGQLKEYYGSGAGFVQSYYGVAMGLADDSIQKFYSRNKQFGNLGYECDGRCNIDWSFKGSNGLEGSYVPPVNVQDSGGTATVSEACRDPQTGEPLPDCYELYGDFADALGDKAGVITDANNTGEFLNGIIAFATGIGGILAVVRIMYMGFVYMRNKREGKAVELGDTKAEILKTVVGFILLLSVYVILRTINPDLLNLTPRINVAQLGYEEGDGGEESVAADQPISNVATKACPAGLVKVGIFTVCKTIAADTERMLAAAARDGITLGGGAYRSPASQIALRAKNCGGNDQYSVYEKPSRLCKPPTAPPGKSMHESGLAFDFTCNGQGIINISQRPNTKVCFDWLTQNAHLYGLKNFPRENWHWSINGR